ncbi:SSI family serine proteinase inhibitor [Streptomyces sp. NPDC096030]|uniref:SSI family serine proteinase inhibitor n=1 Tax=Streptomyces sp. NPDC096030 TaxID=3155423 RepID=UPI00331E3F92
MRRLKCLLVAGAALLALPLPSAHAAEPAGTHQDSFLILSQHSRDGEGRTVTLGCPEARGSHPAASEACISLEAANGLLAGLPMSNLPCPTVVDPVTVFMAGVWKGEFISQEEDFSNRCFMYRATGAVFDF